MRTIATGKLRVRWFVGYRDTCPDCRTVVEFDASDEHRITVGHSYQDDGDEYLRWRCPCCYRVNTVVRGATSLWKEEE